MFDFIYQNLSNDKNINNDFAKLFEEKDKKNTKNAWQTYQNML